MKARTLLIAIVVVGLVAALMVLTRRAAVEDDYRDVALAVDLDEVRLLADAMPATSLEQVLTELKEAGITSVAVTEPLLGDMLAPGMADVLRHNGDDGRPLYRIYSTSTQVQQAINNAIRSQDLESEEAPAGSAFGSIGVVTYISPSVLTRVPLGFTLQAPVIETIQQDLGLEAIARVYNFPVLTASALENLVFDLSDNGMNTVIFAADEVGGYRGAVEDVTAILQENGIRFGAIEFGKQKGSDKMSALLEGRYVRVHSISPAEMANYQPSEAVERFVRAARERNIRVLYVRLLTTSGADALEQNVGYIAQIAAGLERSGLQPGSPKIFADPRPAQWETLLIAAGVAAGVTLALTEIIRLGGVPVTVILWAVTTIVLCGAALTGELGRKIIALAAALAFPVWGLLATARMARTERPSAGSPFMFIAGLYLTAIAIALSGGVLIAAVLSGREFMMATERFAGVKLAHLLPVLVAAVVAFAGTLGEPVPWQEWKRSLAQSCRRIWNTPVLFSYAVVGLIALVMLLVVVLRSGNEAGVGVSSLELRFRALLDYILYVRPRTKEIFLGYPALIAAIWLARRAEINWSMVFFVGGMVGLISLVNTMCHIHTPLGISAIRIFNGVWVGAIGGVILVWLLKALGLGSERATAGE